jgi:hypothetical protein
MTIDEAKSVLEAIGAKEDSSVQLCLDCLEIKRHFFLLSISGDCEQKPEPPTEHEVITAYDILRDAHDNKLREELGLAATECKKWRIEEQKMRIIIMKLLEELKRSDARFKEDEPRRDNLISEIEQTLERRVL